MYIMYIVKHGDSIWVCSVLFYVSRTFRNAGEKLVIILTFLIFWHGKLLEIPLGNHMEILMICKSEILVVYYCNARNVIL